MYIQFFFSFEYQFLNICSMWKTALWVLNFSEIQEILKSSSVKIWLLYLQSCVVENLFF